MRAKNSTETAPDPAPERLPDLRNRPNEWAVASAAQNLMGKLTPGAFQFALALAGHVEYSGAHFKVWPGQRRLKSMCGIGSFDTIRRIVAELEQHKLVSTRHDGGRNTTRYVLNYVTVPDWVKVEIPKAVDSVAYGVSAPETGALHQASGNPVDNATVSAPVSRGVSAPVSGAHLSPSKYFQEEEEERGERGRHDPPPRNDAKTIVSHPLSSPFEAKAHLPINQVSEFIEPSEEARRAWAVEKMVEIAGPAALKHLGEGRGDKAPDWQPWLKLGLTRRQWLRKERRERLDDRRKGEDLLSSKAG